MAITSTGLAAAGLAGQGTPSILVACGVAVTGFLLAVACALLGDIFKLGIFSYFSQRLNCKALTDDSYSHMRQTLMVTCTLGSLSASHMGIWSTLQCLESR